MTTVHIDQPHVRKDENISLADIKTCDSLDTLNEWKESLTAKRNLIASDIDGRGAAGTADDEWLRRAIAARAATQTGIDAIYDRIRRLSNRPAQANANMLAATVDGEMKRLHATLRKSFSALEKIAWSVAFERATKRVCGPETIAEITRLATEIMADAERDAIELATASKQNDSV